MKTTTIALQNHIKKEETTLATCWLATLTNNTVFGFTDHDVALFIDGVTFYPETGYTPSAIESSSNFNVDNLEVDGAISSSVITDEDILSGKWDYAKIEVFIVDYTSPNAGKVYKRSGWFGEITSGKSQFHAELRGMTQKLQQSIGRVISASCDAQFGDARCGVNLTPYTFNGVVTLITDQKTFSCNLISSSGSFDYGIITWLTGNNATIKLEVKIYTVGHILLQLPCPRPIQVGDTFTAVWGCKKRFTEDCLNTYNNTANFRGYPYVPGVDQLTKGLAK